jgi:hypothetical protein
MLVVNLQSTVEAVKHFPLVLCILIVSDAVVSPVDVMAIDAAVSANM